MTDWSAALFDTCVAAALPIVIDADGLNLLAQRSQQTPVQRDKWVLTPHPAEAARLLACEVSDIQQDRVSSAVSIAKRFGACVVLKGCGSVVADASGNYAICPAGNPGMATAGSGDVLTGIIAALLGQGLSGFDAACAGALAHAMAGDFAVDDLGEMAMIAGDIIDRLPDVWKSVSS
jgi:NAD(P)H-hydrate epimerase